MIIEPHITRITGIDNALVANAPTFKQIAKKVSKFCNGVDVLMGQNIMFDFMTLLHNFERIGKSKKMPVFPHKICTIEMAYPIKNKRMTLPALFELATGKELVGGHRADVDAIATLACYEWLLEEGY